MQQLASSVEKSILSAPSGGNVHLAEERQQIDQKDTDEVVAAQEEEMKYSGVYRSSDSNNKQQTNHSPYQP